MRGFGLIGVVLALAIVGVLAKRQGTVTAPAPAAAAEGAADRRTPGLQLQQDVQRALEAAAQAKRAGLDAP